MNYLFRLLLILFFALPLQAQELEPIESTPSESVTLAPVRDTLRLENEFISIILNNEEQDKGRFAIETTLGDPKHQEDDNQSLIYGRPIPWTSFTTVKVDGKPYIFGNVSKKQQRRSGTSLNFSPLTHQSKTDSTLLSDTVIDGVRVMQRLSFARNPSSQVKDTAMIAYELVNETQETKSVGIRLMLDTKLGLNDGAPLRIGIDEVVAEKSFSQNKLSDYWQTFDNLASPNIIAQGTFSLPEQGVTPPDEIFLVNWGTLADNPWDFIHIAGRPFIRDGELEKDTALALYWNPIQLAPGETRRVRTLYGLGAVSVSPGELSLGISAPAEIPLTSDKEVLVMGYVHNAGGYDSYDTKASFIIPKGMSFTNGIYAIDIGVLHAGETRQLPAKLRLNRHITPGKKVIKLQVSSSTFDANTAERTIRIPGAPKLESSIQAPTLHHLSTGRFVPINVRLHNPNTYTLGPIDVSLSSLLNLKTPSIEAPKKTLKVLKPNATTTINWMLELSDTSQAQSDFEVTVKSALTSKKSMSHSLRILPEVSASDLLVSPRNPQVGDYITVTLNLSPEHLKSSGPITLLFDDSLVEFVRYSVPEFLRSSFEPTSIRIEPSRITLNTVPSPESKTPFSFKVHFKAKQAGNHEWLSKKGTTITAVRSVVIQER